MTGYGHDETSRSERAWAWFARIPGAIRRHDNGFVEHVELRNSTIEDHVQQLMDERDYSFDDALLMVAPDRSRLLPPSPTAGS